jgi:hypothetical protein
MAFAEDLAAVAKSAMCGLLANGGNLAAVNIIKNGVRTPASAVVGLGAGLGLLALNYACNYDPNQTKPGTESPLTGCSKAGSGSHLRVKARRRSDNVEVDFSLSGLDIVKEITKVERGTAQNGDPQVTVWQKLDDGYENPIAINLTTYFNPYTVVTGAGSCDAQGAWPPGAPTWDTPVTAPSGCQMIVNLDSFLMNEDGSLRPVMKIRPAASALATGGVIGGCNFNPIVYVGGDDGGGGGDPPWYVPWQDQPDGPGGEPWWYSLLRGTAGGLVSAAVGKLLDEIFAAKLPATVYRLRSVCETGTSGGAVDLVREVVIPSSKVLDGIAARLDALPVLTQGLKDFKQPVCSDHTPKNGIAHRVRFISAGVSPRNGKRYLKDLGYRDQSGRPLAEHREHWKTFRWESGPFLVSSRGLPWGQPQVWAASFEEGRRVLTHAAAIAGVDVSSESHRWFERVSYSARIGAVESFGVARDRTGEVWVVTRDSPDGWPELAPEHRTDS